MALTKFTNARNEKITVWTVANSGGGQDGLSLDPGKSGTVGDNGDKVWWCWTIFGDAPVGAPETWCSAGPDAAIKVDNGAPALSCKRPQ